MASSETAGQGLVGAVFLLPRSLLAVTLPRKHSVAPPTPRFAYDHIASFGVYSGAPASFSVYLTRCSRAKMYQAPFPDPDPLRGKEGLGTSVNFVRFKSCDTCLCACAFQQRARDRELRIVSCLGGGVWVAVTRDFERDICVTSEILQSDWTLPNRAPVPRKSTDPLSCGSHVRVWGRDYPGHDHVCAIFADSAPSNVCEFPIIGDRGISADIC